MTRIKTFNTSMICLPHACFSPLFRPFQFHSQSQRVCGGVHSGDLGQTSPADDSHLLVVMRMNSSPVLTTTAEMTNNCARRRVKLVRTLYPFIDFISSFRVRPNFSRQTASVRSFTFRCVPRRPYIYIYSI